MLKSALKVSFPHHFFSLQIIATISASHKFVNIKNFNLFSVENFWFLRPQKTRQLPSFHTGVGDRVFRGRGYPPSPKRVLFGTFSFRKEKVHNPRCRRSRLPRALAPLRRIQRNRKFSASGKLSLATKKREACHTVALCFTHRVREVKLLQSA